MKHLSNIFTFFKKNERLLLYVGLLMCVVFWHRSCQEAKTTKTIKVNLPQIDGSFSAQKPIHSRVNIDSLAKVIRDTIHPEVFYLTEIMELADLKTDSLLEEYQNLESEYKRYKLFQEFVSTKTFKQKYEDQYLTATINGLVRGEVESMQLDYTLKPRTIETEIEVRRKKRFSIGPYFGYDLLQLEPSLGVSINYGIIRF